MTEDLWMPEGLEHQHKKKIENCPWQKSFSAKKVAFAKKFVEAENFLLVAWEA